MLDLSLEPGVLHLIETPLMLNVRKSEVEIDIFEFAVDANANVTVEETNQMIINESTCGWPHRPRRLRNPSTPEPVSLGFQIAAGIRRVRPGSYFGRDLKTS